VVAEVMNVSVTDIVEDRGGLPRMLAAYIAVKEGLVRLREVAAILTLRSSGHISDLVRRCARSIGQERDVAARAAECLARLRPVRLALS
jgi:hypothetical protein